MKIGVFTDAYLPQVNGVTTSILMYVKELEKRGHEVSIITAKHGNYKDKRKNIYRLTSFKISNKTDVSVAMHIPEPILVKILRKNFDVIHGHSGGPVTMLGWEISQLKNTPYVFTYHTMWPLYSHYVLRGKFKIKQILKFLSRVSSNNSDAVVVPTKKISNALISYGVDKPIQVIPTGIDLEAFKNVKKGYLRKQYAIGKEQKIILCVGRLAKEKSQDFIIQSFKEVHKRYPDAILCLVGDGPKRDEYEKHVKKFHLTGKVIFTGTIPLSEMPKVYADADLFVFASKTETQGLVVMEALASGVAVIAVDDAVYDDLIKNNSNGILTLKNKAAFAAEIIHLLENDTARNKISKQAKITAQKFSIETTVNQMEKIYLHLIMTNRKRLSLKTPKKILRRVANKIIFTP